MVYSLIFERYANVDDKRKRRRSFVAEMAPSVTRNHIQAHGKHVRLRRHGENVKLNNIKVDLNANIKRVYWRYISKYTGNRHLAEWLASGQNPMNRDPRIDSGGHGPLVSLKVDRYDMTGALSGSHERLHRARHGGTPQMETPQRRQHFPTSVPGNRLLQSGGYTRCWCADQLEPPHPIERSE